MILRFPMRRAALALALLGTGGAHQALAQTVVTAPNPEADRLAQEMRVLAADPRDVRALLEAGLLSVRLGDTSAALAFFARAETIDPTNPRIAAGRAAALVRLERPGEALRLFQSAEARGLSLRDYAGERGFAYDLLGQPVLAQQDYQRALQGDRDDETVRRYALSLGISGEVDVAMRELDPLLRRSDRAAWRARAFILAMNGDIPGAEKIAASMMPGNMGSALSPFFRRLATLSPADRAFAVHFGELSPTRARLADMRLAPALPRYVPAPRPVQVAVAPPPPQTRGRDRRSRRERERDSRRAAEARPTPAPAPVETAAAALPAPPQFVARAEPSPIVQPLPQPRADDIDASGRTAPPARPVTRPVPTPAPAPVQMAARAGPPPERSTVVPATSLAAESLLERPAAPRPQAPRTVPEARPAPVVTPPAPEPTASEPTTSEPAAEPPAPQPQPVAVAARPEPTPPGPARVGEEDSVLASIVGNITIPAEELEAVTSPAPAAAPPEPAPEPVRTAPPPAARPKPEPARSEAKPAAKKPEPKPAAPKLDAKPDPKAAAKKGDPKKPDPKKPDPKKPDPKKPDPAKAEPKRVWVQVAGGANEESLEKAWKAVVAKAPALKGKTGWWTPLRATNRVLTGPFKSAAEAQAFVNTLGKSGVSAFVFTSEAGQKVTRLGAK